MLLLIVRLLLLLWLLGIGLAVRLWLIVRLLRLLGVVRLLGSGRDVLAGDGLTVDKWLLLLGGHTRSSAVGLLLSWIHGARRIRGPRR